MPTHKLGRAAADSPPLALAWGGGQKAPSPITLGLNELYSSWEQRMDSVREPPDPNGLAQDGQRAPSCWDRAPMNCPGPCHQMWVIPAYRGAKRRPGATRMTDWQSVHRETCSGASYELDTKALSTNGSCHCGKDIRITGRCPFTPWIKHFTRDPYFCVTQKKQTLMTCLHCCDSNKARTAQSPEVLVVPWRTAHW